MPQQLIKSQQGNPLDRPLETKDQTTTRVLLQNLSDSSRQEKSSNKSLHSLHILVFFVFFSSYSCVALSISNFRFLVAPSDSIVPWPRYLFPLPLRISFIPSTFSIRLMQYIIGSLWRSSATQDTVMCMPGGQPNKQYWPSTDPPARLLLL